MKLIVTKFRRLVEGPPQADWTPIVLRVDHSYWTVNQHPDLKLIKVLDKGDEGFDSTVRVLASPNFLSMIRPHGKVFTMGLRLELLRTK